MYVCMYVCISLYLNRINNYFQDIQTGIIFVFFFVTKTWQWPGLDNCLKNHKLEVWEHTCKFTSEAYYYNSIRVSLQHLKGSPCHILSITESNQLLLMGSQLPKSSNWSTRPKKTKKLKDVILCSTWCKMCLDVWWMRRTSCHLKAFSYYPILINCK